MAAGAAIGPEVVVGAGVRVEAAAGAEHLGSEENIWYHVHKRIRDVYPGSVSASNF
jgi:hypothetical protein